MSEVKHPFAIHYTRFALKELRDRMKVLEQICGFLEDQSDIENRFGLAFQKV